MTPLLVHGQEKKSFEYDEKFPIDSIKIWTKDLMTELSTSHPGYYRFTTPERFNFIIDSTLLTVREPLTTIQYYRKLKPLISQIGCLHTSVTLSDQYYKFIADTYKLFPFEVYINDKNQAFITKNHSTNKDIPLKSEILTINDRPVSEIIRILRNAIPSDGYNQTLKTLLLCHRFSFWYQTAIELSELYTLEIKTDSGIKKYQLQGVDGKVFPTENALGKTDEEQLLFKIEDNIGYLTIRTFAKTKIKRNKQKFKKFIKESFENLENNGIKNLVIDLRYNTGGTDGNAALLASYFFDTPFRYWEKVEVTESIAEQIKGANRIFYKKPVKIDTSYHWLGARSWLTKEFDYYKTQKPAKKNFKGKTYLITNGLCMSSCSDFVAIISDNTKAEVVGQESGGGFQGNTSGMMPTNTILKNIEITIPLQKYTNAVNLKKNRGRGIVPDYSIQPTLDDWIEKNDIELQFTRSLIKERADNK